MPRLIDSVVFVTGANGGLGTEFVHQALARGATKVYAAARRPRTWGDSRVIPLSLDVTDPDSVEHAAHAAPDTTVVVNNAGIAREGSLLDGPLADTREQMETNFFGPLLVARAFVSTLRQQRGSLINISSVLAWYPVGEGYSASKAALWSATNAMRLTLGRDGVHVLGAYFAQTDTPIIRGRATGNLNDPADVVTDIYDGLEAGVLEVLADQTTVQVRAALSAPLTSAD